MTLELRQSLGLVQQLIMTPQLQQAIKLLQLSRLELLEAIQEELEINPVLEEQVVEEDEADPRLEGEKEDSEKNINDLAEVTIDEHARDDVDWETYISEYNTGSLDTPNDERDFSFLDNVVSTGTNLYSHLIWQLKMSNLDEEQREVGVFIIGNLNENGYLDITLEEISLATGCPLEKVIETLNIIQLFDPVGVAARDVRECLLIQARFQNLGGTIVEKLIMDHLESLEDKKFDQVAKQLSVQVKEILMAVSIIRGLDPKPGRSFSDEETIFVTPDIYVYKVGENYQIIQNEDGMPKLRVSAYYKELLRNRASISENAREYIQEKLKSAAWLIKSIQQRQRTIYRVTESIIRFQKGFFDDGITKLKPLVLRDVAEDISMHESTVSRVTTNKYVQTPQGLYELKFFFNSAINGTDGGTIASESVRDQIRKIINTEDAAKPYSDIEIVDILKKLNIKVARRTIAKYRESMGILPSRKRKNPY
ncbi:MAG TPA: RNA polymerase factor sigma-54 [Desulfobacteraceae bacterium]|nr:RNA polymerase factor sigma-54 [Desulfobacteraceae bacterium]HPJ66332.1 RNA polymerase factor sigma-54 [Desulfobacteraceae bacterium]HPQ27176.1 RNA polymerase factor sigma-54 [Desulfobacteraceae bacterium]